MTWTSGMMDQAHPPAGFESTCSTPDAHPDRASHRNWRSRSPSCSARAATGQNYLQAICRPLSRERARLPPTRRPVLPRRNGIMPSYDLHEPCPDGTYGTGHPEERKRYGVLKSPKSGAMILRALVRTVLADVAGGRR